MSQVDYITSSDLVVVLLENLWHTVSRVSAYDQVCIDRQEAGINMICREMFEVCCVVNMMVAWMSINHIMIIHGWGITSSAADIYRGTCPQNLTAFVVIIYSI